MGSGGWNRGLTKETDPRVKSSGMKGKHFPGMGNNFKRKGEPSIMLGKHHTQETKDKCRDAALGRKPWNKGLTKETDSRVAVKPQTQETKDRHRKASREYWRDPEVHQQRSLGVQGEGNPFYGKQHTDESKDKQSKANVERWKDPQRRKNQSVAMKVVWADPEWAEEMSAKVLAGNQSTRPNGPEKKVIEILKSMVSDIKYVGEGTFWVEHKNPDFVNENKKQIIEVLGCFWHGCKKCYPDAVKLAAVKAKVKLFEDSGYEVLCIWEHELENLDRVTSRIRKFSEAKQ
jgi:G:T-mismatch repair DNA endonuclease (very short patch repair protein)